MTEVLQPPVVVETDAARRRREAYFSATQSQLIWARFKRNRSAMIALTALALMVLAGFFAPFLSPYDPSIAGRDTEYENGRAADPAASGTITGSRSGPSSTA